MKELIASNEFQQKIRRLAAKYLRWTAYHFDISDLMQIGNEASMKSISDYDPSRGAAPSTFFLMRAKSAIMDACRHECRANKNCSRIRSGIVQYPKSDAVIDVHAIYQHLTPEDVEVLSQMYLEEKTIREIAPTKGCSPALISWRHKRAIRRARAYLKKDLAA